MGVWIEMSTVRGGVKIGYVTPCVGVWIEIDLQAENQTLKLGHSLRGSVD